MEEGRREEDGADGGLCFGLADREPAVYRVGLLVHTELPGLEVQILPAEGQKLTTAQAGAKFE